VHPAGIEPGTLRTLLHVADDTREDLRVLRYGEPFIFRENWLSHSASDETPEYHVMRTKCQASHVTHHTRVAHGIFYGRPFGYGEIPIIPKINFHLF